jgi:hypothetical protein
VYGKEYTEDQRKAFENYMNEGLEKIEGEYEELKMIFLEIYANPVKNKKL